MKRRSALTGVADSPMVQIATIAKSRPGSVKLCYGESDMPTPAFICAAANYHALAGHTFYTHTAGYRELREALAEKVLCLVCSHLVLSDRSAENRVVQTAPLCARRIGP